MTGRGTGRQGEGGERERGTELLLLFILLVLSVINIPVIITLVLLFR